MTTPQPLRVVVGRQVRRLREESGSVTQGDISRAAHRLGLTWSRSKVAALERGEKAISAEELLLLPHLLTMLLREAPGQQPITLADLFDSPDPVALTDLAGLWARDVVESAVTGNVSALRIRIRHNKEDEQRVYAAYAEHAKRMRALGIRLDMGLNMKVADESGEPEYRAAKRLGLPRGDYTMITAHMWGQCMTRERDARLARVLPGDATKETVQAKRGRITRELDDEVRRFVAERTQGSS